MSAAFSGGDALRPDLEANQGLYRVERIDAVLRDYGTELGVPVDAAQIERWMSNRDAAFAQTALADVTERINGRLWDERPRFVVPVAEFPNLELQPTWPRTMCERCGLAHHFTGSPVTLALFRYSVDDVLSAHREADPAATVFAVPTVLDLPMSNLYFAAPRSMHFGHAVGLEPKPDCSHLAAELVHAKVDYRPEQWIAVGTVSKEPLRVRDVAGLRADHLTCLRETPGNERYGANCVD